MEQSLNKIQHQSLDSSRGLVNHVDKKSFFQSAQVDLNPFFKPAAIQPKLEIGQPNDKYEQEADQVADAVMRMPAPQVQRQPMEEEEEELQMKQQGPKIQRKCQECEEEDKLQKKSDGNAPSANHASSEISSQLSSRAGTGNRLPKAVQSEMSHKMGADFSGINIHTDSKSHQLNQQLGAKAFTHGSDIYFNKGEYNPALNHGKRLLAHELTHVIQQSLLEDPSRIQRDARSDVREIRFLDLDAVEARALAIAESELNFEINARDADDNPLPGSFYHIWPRVRGALEALQDPSNAAFAIETLGPAESSQIGQRHFDPSLIIAIAARESGARPFIRTRDPTYYHTYFSGGLDSLGRAIQGRLTEHHVAGEELRRWQRVARHRHSAEDIRSGREMPLRGLNEQGRRRHSAALRMSSFLTAYAAYLNAQWDDERRGEEQSLSMSFLGTAGRYGFNEEEVRALSPLAQRIWHAMFFGAFGGADISTWRPRQIIGGRTLLSFFEERGYALEDITRIGELTTEDDNQPFTANRRELRATVSVAVIAEAINREVRESQHSFSQLINELAETGGISSDRIDSR